MKFNPYLLCAVVCISFFIFSLSGCVEEPSPLGASTLPQGDAPKITTDTLYSIGSASTTFLSNNTGLDRFYLGNYNNYTAYGFIQFYWPDSLFGAQVIDATVRLKAISHKGNSPSVLSFTPYQMIKPFSGDSLTFDSVNTDYYTSPGTAFSGTISSDGDTIAFPLDPGLLTHWMDSSYANYGLLLKPTNNSIIQGFSSYASYDSAAIPTLTIHYKNGYGENWYLDTVSNTRFLAKIDSTALVTDNKKIYVQSGAIYRGVITFDLSKLPNPCFVNSAYMELRLASESPDFVAPDSVESLLIDNSNNLLSTTLSVSTVTSPGGTKLYRLDTRTAFPYWFKKLSTPRMLVYNYNESSSFDLHIFYGGTKTTNAALCPRIIVTYSTK